MALNATQSVDILFKKFVTSKATTTTSKQYFEEGYTSVPNVLNNNIWLQSDQIPNTATTSSVTQFISVTMSYISGSNGAFYDSTGTLVDIIPFGYGDGSSYNYQIFRNNGTTPISSGQSDWFFDNNSGILTFFSGTLTAGTILDNGPGGSGQTLATPALPPIAKVWKYVGKKGTIPNLNGLTYSGGTMSINIGTGLTFSNGQLTISGSIGTYSGGLTFSNGTLTTTVGNGLTNSNNSLSVIISNGLTFSNGQLLLNIGTGLTFSNNQLSSSSVTTVSNGLTANGNTYSVNINSNGLTFSNSQLSLNIGTGLTFSNGQLTSIILLSNGLTASGNTYSVNINSNGLTFSNSQLALNIGTGLTFSSGQLQSTSVTTVGNGLTANGNTYSVNINSNGLTFSNSQLALNIGAGLTFSSGQLQSVGTSVYAGSGLTKSGNTFSVLLDGVTPGLTVSSNGLKIIDLIMTTSSVKLDTNILGEYTTDPTTLLGWGVYSIPTKGYVDAIASGLTLKQAVRVAATGSISISSAPSSVDGISLSSGDRILLWKQDGTVNGTSSNGIYVYNGVGSPMTRSTDMDGNPPSEVTTGIYTFVTEGSTYQGSGFVVVASGTVSGQIQVGTQSMKWTQFSSAGNYIWNNGLIATGNVVDIDLFNNGGLTFSGGQLKIDLASNSGLNINNGLYINTTFAGTGLTMNNGVMSVSNPILASSGLTNSGLTFSVNLKSNSGLTFSNGLLDVSIGTGLTVSSGLIVLSPLLSNGLTYSGGSYSVSISGFGLTFSSSSLSIDTTYFSKGLTVSNQNLIVDTGNGLTFSNNTLVSNINSNGLTFSNSQISLNVGNGLTFSSGILLSNIGNGLTFSNGQLTISGYIGTYSGGVTFSNGDLTTTVGNGLTNSNNSLSVIISNGLTFSNSQLALNIGSGLTFSNNNQLSSTSVTTVGNGLTANGNTYSVNINSNGLTFSSGQVSLNIGTGLTFSSSRLNVLIDSIPSGLTLSSTGIKVRYNQTSGLDIYSTAGSTENQLYINWNNIIGNGLTWSGTQLNTSSAVLKKYTDGPLSFTASVTKTITHNIGNTEYIIQMYANSTGDEILSQYSGRTTNTIDITVFEDTSDAKIVIIG